MDQKEIIEGCKRGHEKAFKALVNLYSPRMMAICIRYLKDSDLAKDVLQDSMISVFRSIGSYSGAGAFDGWLSRIVVRNCLKEIKNKRQIFDLNVVDLLEVNDYHDSNDFSSEDLMTIINKLPELQRIVFNMHIVEGFNHAEIGELLGIPESSSRVYLTRARKWLKEKIENVNTKESIQIKYKT